MGPCGWAGWLQGCSDCTGIGYGGVSGSGRGGAYGPSASSGLSAATTRTAVPYAQISRHGGVTSRLSNRMARIAFAPRRSAAAIMFATASWRIWASSRSSCGLSLPPNDLMPSRYGLNVRAVTPTT